MITGHSANLQNSFAGCLPVGKRSGTTPFSSYTRPGFGSQLGDLVDLDGDGVADVAMIASKPRNIYVILLTASLTAKPGAPGIYTLPAPALTIRAVDVNKDGKPDLVVVAADSADGRTPAQVYVLINKGDGTFNAAVPFAAGVEPFGFAVMDVNGDGNLDLIVADRGTLPPENAFEFPPLTMPKGKQTALRQPAGRISARPRFARTAATGSGGGVSILLGNGAGGFGAPTTLPTAAAQSVTMADFNGDGKMDIAAATGSTVTIMLAGAGGTFGAPSTYTSNGDSTYLAVGDFNGDGKLDLASGNGIEETVTIMLGNGAGGFQAGASYPLSLGPEWLVVTDFNNDGVPDILTANGYPAAFVGNPSSNVIDVLFGNGDGTFQAPQAIVAGQTPINFGVTGDFNGDHKLDVVVATQNSTQLQFYAGHGDGTFAAPVSSSDPSLSLDADAISGDFNGDGKADLAINNNGSLQILLSQPNGTFQPQAATHPMSTGPQKFATGDFNGDGKLDLAVLGPCDFFSSSGTVNILVGSGSGTFQNGTSLTISYCSAQISVADLNHDGKPDLVTVNNFSAVGFASVDVFLNNGNGTFASPTTYQMDPNGGILVGIGDVNGDGVPDIVSATVFNLPCTVRTLIGKGDGTFRTGSQTPMQCAPSSLTVADMNGDGKADVLIGPYFGQGDTTYMLSNGDGSFGTSVRFPVPTPNNIEVVDFNNDGKPDLFTTSEFDIPAGFFTATLTAVSIPSTTIQTNPEGLQFTIDGGQPQTAPQTIFLTGTHTIAVPQNQPGTTGTQYVFTSWSDGGGASHPVTMGAATTTFTAVFKLQYQLTIAAAPSNGGTVTPQSNTFYDQTTVVPITATANNGFQFTGWTGPVASASSASTTVTMSGPESVTANFSASAGGTTIQTIPSGLQFTVDGGPAQTAPQTLNLPAGSHTIAVSMTQPGATGTQYVFTSWNDGGGISHPINVSNTAATYTATFKTQYQLTITASPANGGSVTPGTGFFDANSAVPITATANSGFQFTSWNGPVASTSSASTTVTMSAPETVTANFSATSGTTIQTNPSGLQFTVDGGTPQTAPQTLNLSPGPHTIAVATQQQGTPGTQYLFTSWNDGGAASHSITVTSTPATFTASFKTQYQLTIAASPSVGGSVSPLTGGYYDMGTVVPISATASAGYQFTSWNGSVANASSASTTVAMAAPESVTANFSALSGTTIQTNPPGLQFSVDGGTAQIAPQTLNLSSGTHTITVVVIQPGATGTQYVFTSWNDGGAASHMITVGSAAATYTASFKIQYRLTTAASPGNGGSVTPPTGFFDANASVSLSATANSGFQFTNWNGPVTNSSSASTTVTMSAPESVTANFTSTTSAGITIVTNPAGLQFSIDGGPAQTAPQTLNLSAGSHIVAVVAQQNGPPGTQYAFTSWNDGGAASHSITVGSTAATYTANFKVQYQLTITVSPANSGTVSPPSGGFYDANLVLPISASPASSYQFASWTGPVANNSSASTTITMSQPQSIVCNFGLAGFTLSPTSANFSAAGGFGSVTLTASVATAPWTAMSNSSFITVTSGPGGTGSGTVSYTVSANSALTTRQGTITIAGQTFTVNQAAALAPLRFLPLAPCRIMDTRGAAGQFGGPRMTGGSTRTVPIPQSACNVPANALAYSLNVTVVPPGPLTYLSIWPAGQTQPVVSTLNSFDGRVVANAAIVPSGASGAVSVFVSDSSDVILDINGVFVPAATTNTQSFYPVSPCRVMDTRDGAFTGAFGPPFLSGGSTRSFGPASSRCGIPATAQAYSLNITVVPHGGLQFLTIWPQGQVQPNVSTLNSFDGSIVANAAIVPAGPQGLVNLFVTNDTDVVVDINGYFAPPGSPGAESLYTVTPCRVVDTRAGSGFPSGFGSPSFGLNQSRSFQVPNSPCVGIPASAQAYSMNVTVVPSGPLGYLTAWPTGQSQPLVSTLNSSLGKVVANAALVPAGTNGAMSIFVTNPTDLILDINAYFAP